MNDTEREETIAAVKRQLSSNKPRHFNIFLFETLKRLVAGRSQEQVSRMEAGLGISAN